MDMKRYSFLILAALISLGLFLYESINSKATDKFIKNIFWQGYDSEDFSAFLNFDSTREQFYYDLKNDTIYLNKQAYGVIVSYNKIMGTLKVRSLSSLEKVYYFGKYGE